jgi:hypothetical protein
MKRFFCSAVITSALLAASAIPSAAATTTIADIGGNASVLTSYDTTYTFTLAHPELVAISGVEFNIDPFSVTLSGPSSMKFSYTPTPGPDVASSFSGAADLTAGTYSLLIKGTGDAPGSPYSVYNGQITGLVTPTPIPGALALFGGGLGFIGLWGWNKRRKPGSGSASLQATAC